MALAQTVKEIAEAVRRNRYPNETAVREAVVVRILMDLGWAVFDPDIVRREFTIERRRVDYALFANANSSAPAVFIEVKAPNVTSDGERQLFEYAFHQGVQIAILVDDREWSFFLPGEQGSYADRRVHKLDLLERDSEDAANILERYLRADRIKNGSAIQDARQDYQSAARLRDAKAAIPRAWNELVTEPDELLMELVAEKVEGHIGFRPSYEQIEAYLAGLLKQPTTTEKLQQTLVKPQPIIHGDESGEPFKGSRKVELVLKGRRSKHEDAISALIYVLKTLSEGDPLFMEQFAESARGRTRNHISRNRNQVYPNKPGLAVYTTDLGGGWWLGTNIANREKKRLIEIACKVAGLRFGVDVQISLPNTEDS